MMGVMLMMDYDSKFPNLVYGVILVQEVAMMLANLLKIPLLVAFFVCYKNFVLFPPLNGPVRHDHSTNIYDIRIYIYIYIY